MGRRNAAEAAELVRDEVWTLEEALVWHLTENHFPMVPVQGVGVAIEALTAMDEGRVDHAITLPSGLEVGGWNVVAAQEVEEYWHLEDFRGLVTLAQRG